MSRVGEIILVYNYIGEDGVDISKHTFIVISDSEGEIQGYQYNNIANVMSTFKSEEHRNKKLSYEENLEITIDDRIMTISDNGKDAFIKANQLFFFDTNKINYVTIGKVKEEKMNELFKRIDKLKKKGKMVIITDNLK